MNKNNALCTFTKMGLKLVLIGVFLFVASFFVRAQESTLRIYYRFDNATVDAAYLSNSQTFAQFDAAFAAGSVSAFEVVAYSSPEGNNAYNEALAARRANAIRSYLIAKYPSLNGKISIRPSGESWSALREDVVADTRISDASRSDILSVIDSNVNPDTKEARLKAMKDWGYFYSNYFRTLRYAEIRIVEGTASEPGTEPGTGAEAAISTGTETATGSNAVSGSIGSAAAPYAAAATSASADVIFALRSAVIDEASYSNRAVLAALASMLEGKTAEDIPAINIVSTASPEGPLALNDRYAQQRGEALCNHIASNYPELAGKISVRSAGEAWDDLKAAVDSDPSLSDASRSKLLSIIVSNAGADAKEAKLRALPEWKHLFEDIFPSLRYARISVSRNEAPADTADTPVVVTKPEESVTKPNNPAFDTTMVQAEPAADTTLAHATEPAADTLAHTEPADTAVSVVPVVPVSSEVVSEPAAFRPKKTIVALKTNLLYDAVTALNFEVEVPIGKRWSIMAEDIFPWWETGNKYCFQMWEIGMEGRYWLKPWDVNGTEKLRGLFGGFYAMSSKYDFQYDKDINYQGEYWSAGITGGYSKPIGRKKRVNLEMSLSLGYMSSDYRHYMPTDDYSKLIRDPNNTGTFYYFGPTKAKISLVVPINVPRKKEVSHE